MRLFLCFLFVCVDVIAAEECRLHALADACVKAEYLPVSPEYQISEMSVCAGYNYTGLSRWLPDSNKTYRCCWNPSVCRKKFDQKSRLIDHILRHMQKTVFVCPVCGSCFVTPIDRLTHMCCCANGLAVDYGELQENSCRLVDVLVTRDTFAEIYEPEYTYSMGSYYR